MKTARHEDPIRVALYSHDTFGLGHLSRCLKLARELRGLGELDGLFLTGLPHAEKLGLPHGFRRASLPAVTKRRDGSYAARAAGASFPDVLTERRRRIQAALSGFDPHLLIVDNVPTGLDGEILPALRARRPSARRRAVLAVRDVLDAPDTVRHEWSRDGVREALQIYDEIWVFGSARAANRLITDAKLAGAIAAKVVACGALGGAPTSWPRNGRRGRSHPRTPRPRPRIVVTGGGGGDAGSIARLYLDALRRYRPKVSSHIVLGPDFCEATLAEMTSHNGFDARIERFVPNLGDALASADLVVSMAGYNTVCEILAAGCASVLIPRVKPRREQFLRARALVRRGRATMLLPERLDARSLWSAVEERLEAKPAAPEALSGGRNALARAAELLGTVPPGNPQPEPENDIVR